MPRLCQLWLTCKNSDEATRIAKQLLDIRLVACAKQIPVTSDYWWHNSQEHSDEVLLLMESRTDLFKAVEIEIKKLHSYETFVLQAVPLLNVSSEATKWLNKELKHD